MRVLPSADPAVDESLLHGLMKVWSERGNMGIPPLHKADPEISGVSQQTFLSYAKIPSRMSFPDKLPQARGLNYQRKLFFNWLIKVNYDQDAYQTCINNR